MCIFYGDLDNDIIVVCDCGICGICILCVVNFIYKLLLQVGVFGEEVIVNLEY